MAELLTTFRFKVLLDQHEYGFSKISGLKRERSTFTVREGGLNDRVHVFPAPAAACGTICLERGSYSGEVFPFYMAGESLKVPMRVEVWDPTGRKNIEKCYTLTGLVVRKWEAGELNALENALLIDRFELDYESLFVTSS